MKRARIFGVRALALCALSSFAATIVNAQKAIEFIKAVPEAPAFTFLGVSPSKVDRPGNLRDLGLSLQNGIGKSGKAGDGFALDASVWNLIPRFDLPLERYRSRNPLWYMLGNLQASIATIRTAGDDGDLQAALGLKSVIVDRGDPMLDEALTQKLAAGLSRCRPAQPGAGQSAACVDSVTADVIGEYTATNWNRPQLAIAAAWGYRFDNAEIKRRAWMGSDVWLVGALPLGGRFQLLGQSKYQRLTAEDSLPSYENVTAALRAVGGSASFNAFVEIAHEWRTPINGGKSGVVLNKDVGGWSSGVEFRLAANTWISTGLGSQFTALKEPERTVVFAAIKWGISSQARLGKLSK